MKTHGSASWKGGVRNGKGAISAKSGALSAYPYGFSSRFEGKPGTSPEELIGAAHAGCFTMALSLILGEAQLTAEHIDTTAEVSLDKVDGGYAISAVHLTLKAKIPDADSSKFVELANIAKANSPGFETAQREGYVGRRSRRSNDWKHGREKSLQVARGAVVNSVQ
jgi:osmotically inducible protein OsmC